MERIESLHEVGQEGSMLIKETLAKLLKKEVNISVSEILSVPTHKLVTFLGGPEHVVSAVCIPLNGDGKGEALIVYPQSGSTEIIDLMIGSPLGTTRRVDESEITESAFKELSNILTGNFLSSISNKLGLNIMPSPPHTAIEKAQSIIDMCLIHVGSYAENVIAFKIEIEILGHHIHGKFMLILDRDSWGKMVRK